MSQRGHLGHFGPALAEMAKTGCIWARCATGPGYLLEGIEGPWGFFIGPSDFALTGHPFWDILIFQFLQFLQFFNLRYLIQFFEEELRLPRCNHDVTAVRTRTKAQPNALQVSKLGCLLGVRILSLNQFVIIEKSKFWRIIIGKFGKCLGSFGQGLYLVLLNSTPT